MGKRVRDISLPHISLEGSLLWQDLVVGEEVGKVTQIIHIYFCLHVRL